MQINNFVTKIIQVKSRASQGAQCALSYSFYYKGARQLGNCQFRSCPHFYKIHENFGYKIETIKMGKEKLNGLRGRCVPNTFKLQSYIPNNYKRIVAVSLIGRALRLENGKNKPKNLKS